MLLSAQEVVILSNNKWIVACQALCLGSNQTSGKGHEKVEWVFFPISGPWRRTVEHV